ncbi:hypothetical protein AB6846_10005, partial [Serratia proteamaculans]
GSVNAGNKLDALLIHYQEIQQDNFQDDRKATPFKREPHTLGRARLPLARSGLILRLLLSKNVNDFRLQYC